MNHVQIHRYANSAWVTDNVAVQYVIHITDMAMSRTTQAWRSLHEALNPCDDTTT